MSGAQREDGRNFQGSVGNDRELRWGESEGAAGEETERKRGRIIIFNCRRLVR